MERLNFNPVNLYEDSVSFPDPASETETRRQLNEGCKQIQAYINDTLAPRVEATGTEIDGIKTLSNKISDAIKDYKLWSGTPSQYESITTKDSNTLYFIEEE